MKKTTCLTFVFLAIGSVLISNAQEIMLEKSVDNNMFKRKSELPLNQSNFLVTELDFYAGGANSAVYEPLSTHNFSIGTKQMHRIFTEHYLGMSFNYQNQSFGIAQNSSKTFPTTGIHDKEKIVLDKFNVDLFGQFTLIKKDDKVILALKLGIFSGILINSRLVYSDTLQNSATFGKYQKVKIKKLAYIEHLNYGIVAGIVYKKLSLLARYGLNSVYKSSFSFPQPSRMAVGVELALF